MVLYKLLWVKCWEARGAIILKMLLCNSDQFRKLKKMISVVEEYLEEILVVEEDDTGVVVYLKSISEMEKLI